MPTVDVAIPCYNYGRYLRECIESVLTQQDVDVRILVVDNASEDDSLAVAREQARLDRRIEVVANSRNMGANHSYNTGVDWAESDYFLLLDADDLLVPGALSRAARLMDENPSISFTHGVELRQIDGKPFVAPPPTLDATVTTTGGLDLIRQLCRVPINFIGANTVIRRTSAQKQAGRYNPALPYTDDLELWLRLALLGDVGQFSGPQAIRRYHPDRMSAAYLSRAGREVRERERAFKMFFDGPGRSIPDSQALFALARRRLGEHAWWSAVAHAARGQREVARDLLSISRSNRAHTGLLPPIRWLFLMENPLWRTLEITAELLPRLGTGVGDQRRA